MPSYLSFRVELLDVRPPIWRSLLIRRSATFQDLHEAIQAACGWLDYHLFVFVDRHDEISIAGIPEDERFGPPDPKAQTVSLTSHFTEPGTACLYRYDFGDDWLHLVTLEEQVELPETFVRRLTGGARAFPPEDCGGIPGYEECLSIRNGRDAELDPDEVEERRLWLGNWDPERFDLDTASKEFESSRSA